jgi:hypothetical protein
MLGLLRNVVFAAWALVGALFLGAVLLYGGFFFLAHPTPWNFPGDPPLFDLLIYAAGIAVLVNAPLWLLARWLWTGPDGLVRSVPRACAMVSLAMFLTSAAGILERHDARWAAIRGAIRQYGDEIATAAGDKDRVLSHEEFEQFKRRFLPTPVPVRLPGYGTVTLRMASGVYPYVGVDFGGGANALFDPASMMCTYSD